MQASFFGGLGASVDEKDLHKTRRTELLGAIQQQYSDKKGVVVLWAAFEVGAEKFRQDKTFFYYTGINEPGCALVMHMDGRTTLFVPHYFKKRAQWMNVSPDFLQGNAKNLGVDEVAFLGNEIEGYGLNSYFSAQEYANMLTFLKNHVAKNEVIFTTLPDNGYEYLTTRLVYNHLRSFIPSIENAFVDISHAIANSRRRKDMHEVEKVYRAIEITELAQEAAMQAIKEGVTESEVQASLEYIMTASGARQAFASIVASGKNSTILHYSENNGTIKSNDLVLVDIGAELNNYCADITRVYPVSGEFTKRQKTIYNLVLETQNYIADLAKPGMWLKNQEHSDKSLHHLAHAFLKRHGYDHYFPHGIGHFLGLDVHDVGDYSIPLQEGDVITIEPGIYIPAEGFGIRIEDNYWITKDGAMCLSENLPKTVEEVEYVMQQALSGESDEEESDDIEEDDEFEEDDFH